MSLFKLIRHRLIPRIYLKSDKITPFDISVIYLQYVIYEGAEILKIAITWMCLRSISYLQDDICNHKQYSEKILCTYDVAYIYH